MLKLLHFGKNIDINLFKFPAGESGIRLDPIYEVKELAIRLDWEGNDDLINLMLLVDAIQRQHGPSLPIDLVCPYFPYARQDRVCNLGESLSVGVVANIINNLKFRSVYILDPYSDVTPALLSNTRNYKDVAGCLAEAIRSVNPPKFSLVCPDAGAAKKILSYTKAMKRNVPIIYADKVRNTKTGAITDTVVHCNTHLGCTDLFIVDDICDGGGTFIPLADKLRDLTDGSIYLFVSHGIFSNGVETLKEVFEGVFVLNNMSGFSDSKIKLI